MQVIDATLEAKPHSFQEIVFINQNNIHKIENNDKRENNLENNSNISFGECSVRILREVLSSGYSPTPQIKFGEILINSFRGIAKEEYSFCGSTVIFPVYKFQ